MPSVNIQEQFETLKKSPTTAALATSSSYELGLLVECAYEMYEKDRTNLRPPLSSNFPSHKFGLVAYLTCSDFFSSEVTERFYGYLVEDKTTPGTYVIALRGTQGWEEWWDDAHIWPVPYEYGGKVEEGFYDIFKTMRTLLPDSGEEIAWPELNERLVSNNTSSKPVFKYVGHSLGSALVNFMALEAAIKLGEKATVELTTFACPLTGDPAFVSLLEKHVPRNTRIVNVPDIVPDIPPGMGYVHVNTVYYVNSHYFQNIRHSYACYHSLLTYLYCLQPGNPLGLSPSCIV